MRPTRAHSHGGALLYLLPLLLLVTHPARGQQCPLKSSNFTGQRLRIFVSPHSHDDVGWDETYLDYFYGTVSSPQNVTKIYEQVVAALQGNPARRWSAVEQAFFQLWYEQQAPGLQADVQRLVASGQLVFLGGGWSMPDEANPTYIDLLDNLAQGHRYIAANFGVASLPTIQWQIDPFGHSAFHGVLSSSLAGFVGVLWGREATELKLRSCHDATLDRVWLPSRSLGAAAATLQGVFMDDGYGAPSAVSRCTDPTTPASSCNYAAAAGDLDALVEEVFGMRAASAGSSDLLFNMGNDFTHENGADYFSYTDGVVAALNSYRDPALGVPVFDAAYSTPVDYVAARLAPNASSLRSIQGDFFPYNNDPSAHQTWNGYFTSRPALKGFVRACSALMQAARQLQAAVGGAPDAGPANHLFRLERALGVVQHHDAIAGTAQALVTADYERMLEEGRRDARAGVAASLSALTRFSPDSPFALCPLANVSVCAPLEAGRAAVLVVHNSLGQAAPAAGVRIAAGFPAGVVSYAVSDARGAPLVAQVVPLSSRDVELRAVYGGGAAAVEMRWLHFQGSLPAAGFSVFFLEPTATLAGAPLTHHSVPEAAAMGRGAGDGVFVSNSRINLTIGADAGFISGFRDLQSGLTLPLQQEWAAYVGFNGTSYLNGSSQRSGAYLFRPDGEPAAPLADGPAAVTLVTGPVVNMSLHSYGYVTQETRLWAGAGEVEVEWTVGPIGFADGQSHEVITRYSTGLASEAQWVTDSNCREGQLRVRNARSNYDANFSEPVAGNYFPTPCLVRLSSEEATLAVAVDRAQGSASLADGQLELMVHRRMQFDDGCGVGEPLNETGPDGLGLVVRGRHLLVLQQNGLAPPAYKAAQQRAMAYPTEVTAFAPLGPLSPAQWIAAYSGSASLLSAPLPPNIHLATAHSLGPKTLLLRLAHLYDADEDPAGSAPASVSLAGLLAAPLRIVAAVEMTLPGFQPLASVPQTVYRLQNGSAITVPLLPAPPSGAALEVTLSVQQIRTFMCTLA